MIQPSFSFLVGVSLPYSIASRRAKGQSTGRMVGHAAWRALILTGLGVFLRSVGKSRTNFTFEDTLSQIGLGYTFLFLLGLAKVRVQLLALVVILVGYWGAFAAYPLPSADFDTTTVGVPKDWPHAMTGLQAHWNKNTNIAWKFDTWFLNLFPRDKPWTHNGGGYATLSFIPTLATMILGLLAGELLKAGGNRWGKVGILLLAGGASLGAGYAPRVLRDLPGRQEDLDAELGSVQRRLVLPLPRGLPRDGGFDAAPAFVLPPDRDRYELDRGIRAQPPDRRLHRRELQDTLRPRRPSPAPARNSPNSRKGSASCWRSG